MRKELKPRPYVIMHMLLSLDEKTSGDFLETPDGQRGCEEYYRLHKEFCAQGFICGRITMEDSFTNHQSPDLSKFEGASVEKSDYVAKKAPYYAICVDPRGVVGWYGADIIDNDEGYNGAHIIEVLTTKASDEYVAFLRDKEISYIFCGEEEIDVSLLCEKLYELFGIEKVLLEGGGKTNIKFREASCIDEVSILVCPAMNSTDTGEWLFHGVKNTKALRGFKLKDTDVLQEDLLLMRYVSKKRI